MHEHNAWFLTHYPVMCVRAYVFNLHRPMWVLWDPGGY